MEELSRLVGGSLAGQRLLAALEEHSGTELPALITAVLLEGTPQKGAASDPPARASLDDAVSVISGLTFVVPRGKHELALFRENFLIKTAKADLSVPYWAIKHLAIVEWPRDPKKRIFLFLDIDPAAKVMNGKQPLAAVVMQTTTESVLDAQHPLDEDERLVGPAPVVICQALGLLGLSPTAFISPDGQLFSSSGEQTGVEAYVKANQGMLFPMAAGLVFLERPALFVPRSQIKCVEFARAGGGSSTFDLYVHLRGGGRTQEFTNISRSEIGAFEDYVRRSRIPIGTGEESSEDEGEGEDGSEGGAEEGSSGAGVSEDDSDDDPEDEDFAPTSSSSEGEGDSDEEGAAGAAGASRSTAAGSGERAAPGSRSSGGGGGTGTSEEGAESEDDDDDDDGEASEEEESDSEESDEASESVELVSEDEFSTRQLHNVIESEHSGQPKAKRQRR